MFAAEKGNYLSPFSLILLSRKSFFSVRTIGSSTKFRFLVLEPPVLALDIHHSSWRNSLPFTSLRSVTIGSGRDFLEGDTYEGQAQGLLDCWLDYVRALAVVGGHDGAATHDVQAVRVVAVVPWVST